MKTLLWESTSGEGVKWWLRAWALEPDCLVLQSSVCHLLTGWHWPTITVHRSWVMALSHSNHFNGSPSLYGCALLLSQTSLWAILCATPPLVCCASASGIFLLGPSQGICTCWSLTQNALPPHILKAFSLTSLGPLLNSYLFRDVLLEQLSKYHFPFILYFLPIFVLLHNTYHPWASISFFFF